MADRFTLTFSEKLKERVRRISLETGMTISEFVRRSTVEACDDWDRKAKIPAKTSDVRMGGARS